jgi:hypothetical protein
VRNPFEGLRPVLELMTREGHVLPATGQAMEDLMRPDHAEVIDRLRMGEDNLFHEVLLETPNRESHVSLKPIHRTERHLLRYFLDGSARTFFLGNIVEGKNRSPVNVAQVGAVAVFRENDGSVRVAKSVHKIVLMVDKSRLSFGDNIQELVEKAGGQFGFHDLMEKDDETEITAGKEPRSRAAHKAHHLMALEEENLGRELARGKDDWLVLDGNLGKDLLPWRDIPCFISVAKSFSREPMFSVPGARGKKTVNLYELLSRLPFSARTCAFSVRAGKAAAWYVRLREQKEMDYPLMGVVKVELPNPSGEAVPSERINEISGAIVSERQSTPHGKDIRWHAHIYAVYLAEQAVKNGFISTEALKAGMQWPVQSPATGNI